ncbi:MAG: hypothetical protein AAF806_10430 [Bacteroidota bacterium]
MAQNVAEDIANYGQEIGNMKSDIKWMKWRIAFNLTISATMLFLII